MDPSEERVLAQDARVKLGRYLAAVPPKSRTEDVVRARPHGRISRTVISHGLALANASTRERRDDPLELGGGGA